MLTPAPTTIDRRRQIGRLHRHHHRHVLRTPFLPERDAPSQSARQRRDLSLRREWPWFLKSLTLTCDLSLRRESNWVIITIYGQYSLNRTRALILRREWPLPNSIYSNHSINSISPTGEWQKQARRILRKGTSWSQYRQHQRRWSESWRYPGLQRERRHSDGPAPEADSLSEHRP